MSSVTARLGALFRQPITLFDHWPHWLQPAPASSMMRWARVMAHKPWDFLYAIGTVIAIGNGQPHPFVFFIQQNKVHAPGINTNAVERDTRLIYQRQAGQHLLFEIVDIPDVMTFHTRQLVSKTVDLL